VDLLADHTLRVVALGAGILGAASGILGCYIVLRRQSMMGHAMAYAALPGIVLLFMLTGSKATPVLLVGAALTAWLAAVWVTSIVRYTRVKFDSALGIALSVAFGLGLMLLTFVQRRPDAAQAGLDRYLFGQAATLLWGDVATIALVASLALAATALLWKELKLATFDPTFAASLGVPTQRLDLVLSTLVVVAVVIGLQAVGVILMSAMVVAPGVAARQWTRRLAPMMIVAGLFGVLAAVTGAVASSLIPRLPTGPAIVLALSAIVAISLIAAPSRGLIWRWMRPGRTPERQHADAVLMTLYDLALGHERPDHGHPQAAVRARLGSKVPVRAVLTGLEGRGLVQRSHDTDIWALTPAGRIEARRLLAPAVENRR
jgi:manganese/zinc/iron transport system permease protein